MDEEKMVHSLDDTLESDSHPNGLLRAESIKAGAQYAREYYAINNKTPSFSGYLERFDKKLDELSENYFGSLQEINLKEEIGNNGEFKGFVDDKSGHLKQAQTAKEWAQWHYKRANEAMVKGDISSAKDHTSRAQSYESQAKDYIESASKYTK